MLEALVGLLAAAGVALLVYVGMRWERARIQYETDAEVARIKDKVEQIRKTVGGMSDDELDDMVYGPRSKNE